LISHDIGREAVLSTDNKAPRELKVTDKRIFTADGDIKDEFKNDIKPVTPSVETPRAETQSVEAPAAAPAESAKAAESAAPREERRQQAKPAEPRQRGDAQPETPFAHFLESLIMQAYMSLGMLRNPYAPQAKTDPAAARQMIDILTMLKEKTAGNLTPEEEDFLEAHLGELKLAYVQRTKNI
jgi:hypothetical protein